MSSILASKGLQKAKKGLGRINPNLLIGGAIVGVVGIAGVILWRLLDPRQIPDKVRETLSVGVVKPEKSHIYKIGSVKGKKKQD